jgi:polyhydroxybutyrate depolymerase
MRRPAYPFAVFAAALLVALLYASDVARAAEAPVRREWKVDGVAREALISVPLRATTQAKPVIFAFHGHGGSMRNSARAWDLAALWPEALVVYPQGLLTPGAITDPTGEKAGWQPAAGAEGDRDLKFFDVMLASLRKEFRIDEHRIYATGHSNGGSFTYLLWGERGDVFAAFAPSSAVDAKSVRKFKPRPAFHVAGEADPLVKFAWQQRMIAALLRLNQCEPAAPLKTGLVTHASRIGTPVVTFIHPGGHEFPAEVPKLIIAFFQQHAKP